MANEDLIKQIKDFVREQKIYCNVINNWLGAVYVPKKSTIVEWVEYFQPDLKNFEIEIDNLIRRLQNICLSFKKIETIVSEIDDQCNWSRNYLNLLFQTISPFSLKSLAMNFYDSKLFDKALVEEIFRHDFVQCTLRLRNQSLGFEKNNIDRSLEHLNNFSYFRNPKNNFVIIGANGSGKSSFSRRTRQILNNNVVIIASQKIFSYRSVKNFSLGNRCRQNIQNYQSQDKLYKNEDFNGCVEDLQRVLEALFEEKNELANDYYDGKVDSRKESTLEKVIKLWNEILVHRKLEAGNGDIQVLTFESSRYPFMSLSDGEKAVFYYIAHILLTKENSYIIVDEPENHLHLALIMKLWDALEYARPDCQFIYLTHNLEFAASRNNAEKIWMKRFIAPDKWEMEKLPIDDNLPEILYMELLGSRKPILFCEGTKASLDYKLYTRLFPNYTVIPVDGHLQVISYAKAFNNSCSIHHNRAIGIIDGDFHREEQKETWKKACIYCLDVQEVENILCDEDLLTAAVDFFHADEDAVAKTKERFFLNLKQKIENQCVEFAEQSINNQFKENMLKKNKCIDELKLSLKNLSEQLDEKIDILVAEQQKRLQNILDKKDYEEGVRRYNNKGLISIISLFIEKEYPKRIFKLLDSNADVLNILRRKYFADVPQNLAHFVENNV